MKLLDVLKKYNRILVRENANLARKYNSILHESFECDENDDMLEDTAPTTSFDENDDISDSCNENEVPEEVLAFFNESKKAAKKSSKKPAKKSAKKPAKKPAKKTADAPDKDNSPDDIDIDDIGNETSDADTDNISAAKFFESEDIDEAEIDQPKPYEEDPYDANPDDEPPPSADEIKWDKPFDPENPEDSGYRVGTRGERQSDIVDPNTPYAPDLDDEDPEEDEGRLPSERFYGREDEYEPDQWAIDAGLEESNNKQLASKKFANGFFNEGEIDKPKQYEEDPYDANPDDEPPPSADEIKWKEAFDPENPEASGYRVGTRGERQSDIVDPNTPYAPDTLDDEDPEEDEGRLPSERFYGREDEYEPDQWAIDAGLEEDDNGNAAKSNGGNAAKSKKADPNPEGFMSADEFFSADNAKVKKPDISEDECYEPDFNECGLNEFDEGPESVSESLNLMRRRLARSRNARR